MDSKKIKILTSGLIPVKGFYTGPILTPHMETVERIFKLVAAGIKVVEVLNDGTELVLNVSNYNTDNNKKSVDETPVNPPVVTPESKVVDETPVVTETSEETVDVTTETEPEVSEVVDDIAESGTTVVDTEVVDETPVVTETSEETVDVTTETEPEVSEVVDETPVVTETSEEKKPQENKYYFKHNKNNKKK